MTETKYIEDPQEFMNYANSLIKPSEKVLEIGPGIRPYIFSFTPKIRVYIEPSPEYAKYLHSMTNLEPGSLVICEGALEFLARCQNNSFDLIILVDVIEHLEREDGLKLIEELERVTRKKYVVFTPLGFMPQDYNGAEADPWGMSATELQTHKSGWHPQDFKNSKHVVICQQFHFDQENNKYYGAFWTIVEKQISSANILNNANVVETPYSTINSRDSIFSELSNALKTGGVIRYGILGSGGKNLNKNYYGKIGSETPFSKNYFYSIPVLPIYKQFWKLGFWVILKIKFNSKNSYIDKSNSRLGRFVLETSNSIRRIRNKIS